MTADQETTATNAGPVVDCKVTGAGVNWPCDATCSPNCGPDAPNEPRTFVLYRMVDESGVSGTGIVAQGVRFADGSAALRWMTEHRSTAVYDSIETLETIHGHGGRTVIRWMPWTHEPPLDSGSSSEVAE